MRAIILSIILLVLAVSVASATTFTQLFTANFGSTKTGQAANLNLTVIDAGGTTRSTSPSWTEETDAAGNATTGAYDTNLTIDTSWQFPLRLKTSITGLAGVVATGVIYSDRALQIADGYTAARAPKLDNLDAPISSRGTSTYAGADTSGTTTLLTRLPQAILFDGSGYIKGSVWAYNTSLDPATYILGATASLWNMAGTIGNKINSAASAGDPWTTSLPGSYTSGQAGYILGGHVQVAPSTAVGGHH